MRLWKCKSRLQGRCGQLVLPEVAFNSLQMAGSGRSSLPSAWSPFFILYLPYDPPIYMHALTCSLNKSHLLPLSLPLFFSLSPSLSLSVLLSLPISASLPYFVSLSLSLPLLCLPISLSLVDLCPISSPSPPPSLLSQLWVFFTAPGRLKMSHFNSTLMERTLCLSLL